MPDTEKLIYTFIPVLIASIIFNPAIGVSPNYPMDPVKGPWFFLGIQELVYEINPLCGGIIFPLTLLILLGLYRNKKIFSFLFWIMTVFYLVMTLIAGLLRGPGWKLLV